MTDYELLQLAHTDPDAWWATLRPWQREAARWWNNIEILGETTSEQRRRIAESWARARAEK